MSTHHHIFHIAPTTRNHSATTLRRLLWEASPFALVVLFFVAITLVSGARTAASLVRQAESVIYPDEPRHLLPALGSSQAQEQLVPLYAQSRYFSARATSPYGDPDVQVHENVQTWLQALKPDSKSGYAEALAELTDAPSTIVPNLIDALSDPDAGIRLAAVWALGSRRAMEAEDSLFFATFDSDPQVRGAAAWALGELDALLALPRLRTMQTIETNQDVLIRAFVAESRLYSHVADSLGVPVDTLCVIAVAPSNGRVYAATVGELYGPENSGWKVISRTPDKATSLIAVDDGQVIYMGTESRGVFWSRDAGVSWEPANGNIPVDQSAVLTASKVNCK